MDCNPETLSGLVAAAAQQDRLAFAELYRLTSPRLYGMARRMMGNETDSKDVLQETYLRVWQRAALFDGRRGAALAWLTGILRNACIDRLRVLGRKAATEETLEAADGIAGSEPPPVSRMDMAKCLAALAERERQVILLAIQFGFSHTEVSERLSVPLGTVKSHARRGLMKLKLCLEQAAGYV